MGHLVPGAHVAELQHQLNLEEEAGRRLNALQAGCLGKGIKDKDAGTARNM